jgi:hypothetical protein
MADNLFFLALHLKEEWRMMTSYFRSRKLFFTFPLLLAVMGFLISSLIPFFERAFDMKQLMTAFHLLLAAYGLFVGGFGFFADEVAERWFRDVNLLIHMHRILPVTFRRIFTWFYIKDIVYYLFLTLLPLYAGAFLSFTIPAAAFVKVVVSSFLSFLIGVSTSFFVSSLYVRTRAGAAAVMLIIGAAFIKFSYQRFPPLTFFFTRNLSALLVSVMVCVGFSLLSLAITSPVPKRVTTPISSTHMFSYTDPLLAKEIIDVRRSGTYQIIITSYIFPLFFLYGIFYFSQRLFNFHLDIPLVFYAVFMGYLSTLVYSWLNNIDPPSPLGILPVTCSQVIKRKITLFLIFSLLVGIIYLLGFSYILKDTGALLVSLVSMGSITFYVASITAWLCGLYPNTQLFNGIILAQYLGAILPVLIVLSVLSLMQLYAVILLVCCSVFVVSVLLYRMLDKKYAREYLV